MTNPNADPGQLQPEEVRHFTDSHVLTEVASGYFTQPSFTHGAGSRDIFALERFCRGDDNGVNQRTSGEISGRDTRHIGDTQYVLEQTARHGLRVTCEASPRHPRSVYEFDESGRMLSVVQHFDRPAITRDREDRLRPAIGQSSEWKLDESGRVLERVDKALFTDTHTVDEVKRWTPEAWAAEHPQGVSTLSPEEEDQLRLISDLTDSLQEPSFDRPASTYDMTRLRRICDRIAAIDLQKGEPAHYTAAQNQQGGITITHKSSQGTSIYQFAPVDGEIGRLVSVEDVYDHAALRAYPQPGTLLGNPRSVDHEVDIYTMDEGGNLLAIDTSAHYADAADQALVPVRRTTRANWEQAKIRLGS